MRDQVLQLSYVATEKGYMDQNAFDSKCRIVTDLAQKRNLEFVMVLKPFCGTVDAEKFFVRAPAPGAPASTPVCSSEKYKNEVLPSVSQSASLEFPPKNTVIMSFPMAVDCREGKRGIGFVSIAGWR